jgi:membrane fusion protein, copper/silver efflux system
MTFKPVHTDLTPVQDPVQPPRRRTDLKIIAIVGLVILAFVLGVLVRGGDARSAQADAATPAAAAQAQTYTCSMHPEIRNPGPGKCPICGMDLIPVVSDGADEDAGPRTLSLSPRAVALMQLQTVPAQRRDVEIPLRFVGKLSIDERRVVDVVVRSDSYIERLHANYTWRPVSRDEPLAELFSPEVEAAARELQVFANPASTVSTAPGTEAGVESAVAKLRRLGVSSDQIEQMRTRGEVPRTYQISSPIDGFLSEMGGHQGHWLSEGEHLAEVTDLSNLWLNLEAYESDLQWLRPGQEAQFQVQAYPDQTFTGTVSLIVPVIDDQTRTASVRLDVPNPDGALMPGMFTSGRVRISGGQDAPLIIPATAPLITGTRAIVYVQVPDAERPTFEGREIVLGPRAGDWYIVRDGLAEGDLVVTHGNFKLDSELQLRGRISMMAPEGGAAPAHDHGAHAPRAEAPPAVTKLEVPKEFSAQLGRVVTENFGLVKALAEDDPGRAAEAAKATREQLVPLDPGTLQGAARDVWSAARKQMDQALEQVTAAEDLKTQRQHFETFSEELTRVIRVFGTGGVRPVYRAMCPMVQGRKAYWLQSWDDITNPYWGAAMYSCGEISETIAEAEHEH